MEEDTAKDRIEERVHEVLRPFLFKKVTENLIEKIKKTAADEAISAVRDEVKRAENR